MISKTLVFLLVLLSTACTGAALTLTLTPTAVLPTFMPVPAATVQPSPAPGVWQNATTAFAARKGTGNWSFLAHQQTPQRAVVMGWESLTAFGFSNSPTIADARE